MNSNQYFPADEVIIQVAQITGDDGFKWRSRGFYLSNLKDGLKQLAHQLQFDVKTVQAPVPTDLRYELPDDFFNTRNLWLFTGEHCTVSTRKNIYHKRNYLTRGDGYLANNDGDNFDDPFYGPTGATHTGGLYFWSIQNAFLMFSDNSRGFRFHLEYNGLGVSDPQQPSIPEFLREPLMNWLGYQVCLHRYRSDPRLWSPLMSNFKKDMDQSWGDARAEAASMDSKAREDLYEELSRFGPA